MDGPGRDGPNRDDPVVDGCSVEVKLSHFVKNVMQIALCGGGDPKWTDPEGTDLTGTTPQWMDVLGR